MRRFALLAILASTACSAFALTSTTTTLSATPSSVVRGGSVQLVAKVARSGASGTPSGMVSFYVGPNLLGAATLSGGSATLSESSASVGLGVYGVVAKYGGDSADSPSTSAVFNVAVQTGTTTAFSISPTDVQQGQVAVLSATVSRTGNSGFAGGIVTFLYGSEIVGTARVIEGVAQLSTSSGTLPLGAYTLTARYNGDAIDLPSSAGNATATITPAVDVLTFRNNAARTGVQSAETVLTPANVNTTSFGKLYTFATDGYAYAQPLFVSNYTMSDGKTHNVLYVFVATGTIYAFDADNNNPAAGYLWKSSIVLSGEQVVTPDDYYGCGNPSPNAGIIGTPTIDRALGVLYVVGKTRSTSGSSTTYLQRIHAISLADGTEKLNGPTVIAPTYPGTGIGSSNGSITFNPLAQNQRAALVEASGSVWITWASHCDNNSYHGWTLGYKATDVSQQTGLYNNTPNGTQGGIWMASGGISSDNTGNLFTVSGNGTFDGNDSGGLDLSDSVQRLAIGVGNISSADWFTPDNEQYLSSNDLDMGTADGVLFDDPSSGVAPHLLATADKTGRVYLLNRYNLGGFETGTGSTNGDLQDFTYGSQIFTNFGFFNNTLYIGSGGQPLGAFPYTPGTATTAGYLATTPSMTTPVTFSSGGSYGGMQPMFSANGSSNAIVWGMDLSGQKLYAFDANNLASELYSSSSNSTRDQPPPTVKFTVPVVANGHVFVAGQSSVAVYGLLP